MKMQAPDHVLNVMRLSNIADDIKVYWKSTAMYEKARNQRYCAIDQASDTDLLALNALSSKDIIKFKSLEELTENQKIILWGEYLESNPDVEGWEKKMKLHARNVREGRINTASIDPVIQNAASQLEAQH